MNFNDKTLTNEFDVINRYKPAEYEHTQDLVDIFTPNTPQSHQCGFIAQSAQQIDQLKHAVVGGQIDEDGKEAISSLSWNTIFSFAVEAVQELNDIVKRNNKSRYTLNNNILAH